MNLAWILMSLALLRLWGTLFLGQLQIKHVLQNRNQVPKPFVSQVDLQAHQKAADYTVAKQRLARLESVLQFLMLCLWTWGGGLSLIDSWTASIDNPLLHGLTTILVFLGLNALIDLPLDILKTFHLESRFGFNKTTWKIFLADRVKGMILGCVLGLPLAAAIVSIIQSQGERSWWMAWGLWTAFSVLMLWIFPAYIAPWFNTFSALPENETFVRIQRLLDRCGFESQGIFVMDGSTRSSHGNAYFTGFGRNKRVVFFDTLLKTLSSEEIEGVLAHELGHFKLKHVFINLWTGILMSGLALKALVFVCDTADIQHEVGIEHAAIHLGILSFMLMLPVITFWLTPISAYLSRANEFSADAFACRYANGKSLATALVKLYRDNASTLTPHPAFTWFYASHPPAVARISALEMRLDTLQKNKKNPLA